MKLQLCLLTAAYIFAYSCVDTGSYVRDKRQTSCKDWETQYGCGTGECIRKTQICDGTAQCKDKGDESLNLCNKIAADCTIPKSVVGTTYSFIDCSKSPANCKDRSSTAVKITCNKGYSIPLSINESTTLECPTRNWNHYSTQCMKCGRLEGGSSGRAQVGFSTVKRSKHPWYVGIYKTVGSAPYLTCGGTLITPKFVVTAANCVASSVENNVPGDISLFSIIAGHTSAEYSTAQKSQIRSVSKIYMKPDFNGEISSYNENIALLKLVKSFKLSNLINIPCFYPKSNRHRDFPPNPLLSVPGWRVVSKQASGSFLETNFQLQSLKDCRRLSLITDQRFFSYDKFCLIINPGVNGLEKTDSGSGIMLNIGDVTYLYGIVSAKISNHINFAIVTNATKQEAWIKRIIASALDEPCPEGNIKCKNGDCLDRIRACNGNDCEDAWEEVPEYCADIKPPVRREECFLPNFQQGTIFQTENCSSSACTLRPGSVIEPFSLVQVDCTEGYALPDSGSGIYPSACLRGKFNPPLAKCTKLCEPLISESLDLTCVYKGEFVPCNEKRFPNTKATYKCKYQFKPINPSTFKGENICQPTGQWNTQILPECSPRCGKRSGKDVAKKLISKGVPAKEGDYPWHIGLYQNLDGNFEHICGGSILSIKTVITAAHCVYQNKVLIAARNFKVVAGKYFRDFSAVGDKNGQPRNVKRIVLGELYTGSSTDFENDLALLRVDRNFHLNNFVLPVCVDWTIQNTLIDGMIGTIVGWGLTEFSNYSSELLEAHLPYWDLRKCRTEIAERDPFFKFLTHDKFCVRYVNGSGTQEGDSGGGYAIEMDGLYYIYGIVSVKPRDRNTFAAFTNVITYISWIRNTMNNLEAN